MKTVVNGSTLGYEVKGTGPAVVLLDTAPAEGEEQIMNLVRCGYRVVLPAPNARADEVVALLNYLGVGRAVFAGGVCRTGVLAALTEKYQRRVRAAVLLAEPQTGKAEPWVHGDDCAVLTGIEGLQAYLRALTGYRKPEWRQVA